MSKFGQAGDWDPDIPKFCSYSRGAKGRLKIFRFLSKIVWAFSQATIYRHYPTVIWLFKFETFANLSCKSSENRMRTRKLDYFYITTNVPKNAFCQNCFNFLRKYPLWTFDDREGRARLKFIVKYNCMILRHPQKTLMLFRSARKPLKSTISILKLWRARKISITVLHLKEVNPERLTLTRRIRKKLF